MTTTGTFTLTISADTSALYRALFALAEPTPIYDAMLAEGWQR